MCCLLHKKRLRVKIEPAREEFGLVLVTYILTDIFLGVFVMQTDTRPYRSCVRIIIRKGNLVLLGERFYNDNTLMYYEFPGGGIEEGDSIEDTVKKESMEEVGVVVDNVKSLDLHFIYDIGYTNPTRAKKYRGGEDVWYVADYVRDDHSVHGKEGDALPHIWVDVSKAIGMIKKGPASKYNEARLAALTKVKKLNESNSNTVLLATEGYKKLKLSDW